MARPHPALLELAAGRRPEPRVADDPSLLRSALEHGMHGLLWTWVRDADVAIPHRVRLAGLDVATRQRHDRLWTTLATVRARLDGAGIGFATIKGVTAESRWYGRTGERPSSDVDVVVAPDWLDHAGTVLRALDPEHPLVDVVADLVRTGGVQAADLRIDGVAVDLHFDLLKLGYPMRAPESVWSGLRRCACPAGGDVPVLGPEMALVHFLVHANKDSFPRLLGYADVARVARDPDVDWDVVGRIVRDEGLETVAGCSLDTIARALGAPGGALDVTGGLRRRVWGLTWPDRATLLGSTGPSRSRRQEVLPFLVRGRRIEALRAAVRIVLPARAAVAERYADIPGGYVVRLLRGRTRSMAARRADLRARHRTLPDRAAGAPARTDGRTKAALLRARVATGPMWLDVSGRSMARSIPGGTRVQVATGGTPRRGEVWAFCLEDGTLVVHRARGATPTGFRFQGDGCVRPDETVDAARLVGRVIALSPARPAASWGPIAGASQRVPRVAVAAAVRSWRSLLSGGTR